MGSIYVSCTISGTGKRGTTTRHAALWYSSYSTHFFISCYPQNIWESNLKGEIITIQHLCMCGKNSCVCVCTYTHMFAGIYMYEGICVHVAIRSWHQLSPFTVLHLICWGEVTSLANIDRQFVPWIPCLCLPGTRTTGVLPYSPNIWVVLGMGTQVFMFIQQVFIC